MAKRHGKAKTPIHNIWILMRRRCEKRSDQAFPNYGGRGIRVCERWQKFENFYADMGDPPPGMWLDRIENDGNYEPGNCQWSSPKEQQRNRTNNRRLKLNKRELTVAEWSEMLGIPSRTIRRRIDVLGWSVRNALTTPVNSRSAYLG